MSCSRAQNQDGPGDGQEAGEARVKSIKAMESILVEFGEKIGWKRWKSA